MNKNTSGRHIWCTEAHVCLVDQFKYFNITEISYQYAEDSYQITKLVWNTHALNFNYCKIGVIHFCKVDMHSALEEQDRSVLLPIRCLPLVLAAKCDGIVASIAIGIHNLPQFFCHDVKFPNLRWCWIYTVWVCYAAANFKIPAFWVWSCYQFIYFFTFLVWPLVLTHSKCRGLLLHLVTLNDTHTHTQGKGLSQNCLPDNTWHSQQTDIHAPGGNETCNPSKQVTADLCLRPCGH